MKTFEITKSSNGNLLIIDHHTKPCKTVHVYNYKGELLNQNLSELDFNKVRFFEKSMNVQGEDLQKAVIAYINVHNKMQAELKERLEN